MSDELEDMVYVDHDYTPPPRKPATCGRCGDELILRHTCKGDIERPQIYGMKDWSHEEQLKHIQSVSAAYPPGTKPPFDWFGFWMYTVFTLAAIGGVAVLAGIAYLVVGL